MGYSLRWTGAAEQPAGDDLFLSVFQGVENGQELPDFG